MEKSLYTPEYQQFLDLLRSVRRGAGVTQIELAARLRITQSLVSKIERGERRLDIGELRALCRALGVTVTELVSRWESGLEGA